MLTWNRLLRRLCFCLLTLWLVDQLGARWLSDSLRLSETRRLPADQETGFLPEFLDRLQPGQPDLVFLGSSPTWGVSIPDPADTYPEQFARALRKAHPTRTLQVHNLAAKGFLAADLNAVLQASLPHAEAFVIQLNYHTFSPTLLQQTPIRHPDLPERLGVALSTSEALKLGLRPTPPLNWNAPLRHFLRRHWWFYRQREALALKLLGDSPEAWLYHRFYPPTVDPDQPQNKPFYTLKTARQTYVVKRYAQNVRFELQPDNTELFFVRQMLAHLKAAGKPAVFFIAPINVEALQFYGVFDQAQYQRNLNVLRQTIETAGFPLLDVNLQAPLSEEFFADISHTLAPGGQAFGPQLWQFSRAYLEARLKL